MATFKAESLFSIPGRTAVITGGGSGLGRMIAKTFFSNGASVTLIDREASRLETVKTELEQIRKELSVSGEIKTIHGELGDKASIQTVVAKVRQMHSEIDILVHCAGIRKTNKISYEVGQPLERLFAATDSLVYEDIELSFRINVLAQYFLTSGLVDYLGAAAKKGGGRGCVICFSSVASKHNGQFVPAYQTTKAAVDHLVKIMAAEFADFYIRVNAISPGLFPSNMNPSDPSHPESNMRFAKDMPARRPGYEQEMAGTALYLASPAGGYMTGDNMHVDGGRLLVAAGKISARL